jgi:hypothetical protein
MTKRRGFNGAPVNSIIEGYFYFNIGILLFGWENMGEPVPHPNIPQPITDDP